MSTDGSYPSITIEDGAQNENDRQVSPCRFHNHTEDRFIDWLNRLTASRAVRPVLFTQIQDQIHVIDGSVKPGSLDRSNEYLDLTEL